MCHLESSSFEAALDVEPFIGLAAVQDTLVTSDLLRQVVQSRYDPQPELLALLVLVDGNVLDVSNQAHVMYKLAFHHHGASANHPRGRVADDKDVICTALCLDKVELIVERFLARLAHGGQHSQTVKISWTDQLVDSQQ